MNFEINTTLLEYKELVAGVDQRLAIAKVNAQRLKEANARIDRRIKETLDRIEKK